MPSRRTWTVVSQGSDVGDGDAASVGNSPEGKYQGPVSKNGAKADLGDGIHGSEEVQVLDKEDGEVVTSHTQTEVSNQARAMNLKPEHNLQKGLKQILKFVTNTVLLHFTRYNENGEIMAKAQLLAGDTDKTPHSNN